MRGISQEVCEAAKRHERRSALITMTEAPTQQEPRTWGSIGVQATPPEPVPRQPNRDDRYVLVHAGQPLSIVNLMRDGRVELTTRHGTGVPSISVPFNSSWRSITRGYSGNVAVEMNFRFFDERRIAEYGDGEVPWHFESAASPWANTGEIPLVRIYAEYNVVAATFKGHVWPPSMPHGENANVPFHKQGTRPCTLLYIPHLAPQHATVELRAMVQSITGMTLQRCSMLWKTTDANRNAARPSRSAAEHWARCIEDARRSSNIVDV